VTIVRASQPPIPNSIYPTKEFGTLLLTNYCRVSTTSLEHVPESCEDGILNLDPFVLKMYKEEITTYNRPQT
jgi:hypothetical protein